MEIIIIGNGIAGLSAVEEIRRENQEINIHMITSEKYYTYYRTQLSNYLAKDFKTEDIYIHPKNWYRENNIKVYLNKEVKSIDRTKKIVYFNNSESLQYDKLLLANGARSFIPPVVGKDNEGVFALRDLDDLKSIQEYGKKAEKGIVIGGGLLGLEAANSLKNLEMNITVIEFFDRLLPRQLDQEGSIMLKKIVEDQGIKVILGAQVEKILGEQKVEGIQIKDGQKVETSFVLFSTGVRSNIQLAKELDLEIDKAIIVDEYMQTSERDIYAAGDVCQFNNKFFGIWPIAMEQGKVAGANMIGKKRTYKEITPSNMLNVMGTKVFSTGDIGAGEGEYDILKVKDERKNIYKKFFFRDRKLVGAILMNDIAMAGKLKNLLTSGKDYSNLLKQDISDEEKIKQL